MAVYEQRQGGEETSAEKCNPDLMGLATPWACELQKKTRPLIVVWVLGAFGGRWLGLSKQVYQLTCLAVDWCFICTHNQVTGVLELFMQCPAL